MAEAVSNTTADNVIVAAQGKEGVKSAQEKIIFEMCICLIE